MRKSRAFLLALSVGIIFSALTWVIATSKYTGDEGQISLDEFHRVQEIIKGHYLRDFDMRELQYAGLKAIVASLGDPYSVYYTPEEFSVFNQNSSGEYYGVGMSIKIDDLTGLAVITSFMEDSVAQEAGLEVGDLIVSIDGKDVTKKSLTDIRIFCVGEDGTPVTIGIMRGDKTLEFTMLRSSFHQDMVEYYMLEDGIGYMRIKQFGGNCDTLFIEGIEHFKRGEARGIVFDLRGNPGGYMDKVVKMLDTLLPQGTLVYTEDKHGGRKTWESDAESLSFPLVVLVNEHTASASEIFAGAIQDYNAGAIVGTRTFGKGVVQDVISIAPAGGAVKITSSQYFTPKGRSIDGNGVYPDYYAENAKDGDAQLDKALEILKLIIADKK